MGSISRITHKRIVILAAVAVLAAGCAVPRLAIRKETAGTKITPAEDISSLLDDEYWRPAFLSVIWNTRLPSKPKMAVVGKHHLVVVDQDNVVYALDRKIGNVKWRHEIALPVDGVTFGAGDIMVLSRDVLHRINEEKGVLVWSKVLNFVPSSEIVRSRFRICAGGWGSGVYAMNAENCYNTWRSGVEDNVLGRIIDVGTRVYVATENGRLSALRGRNGYEEWGLNIGGRVVAGLAMDGQIVYVASRDKFLSACSRLGKGLLWKIRVEGPIVTTPVAVEGSVYFSAEGDGLYAADTKGKVKWKVDGQVDVLSAGRRVTVLVRECDDASEIMIVEADSGKQRSAVKIPGFNMFPVNVEGPEIFCLSESGYIIALKRL